MQLFVQLFRKKITLHVEPQDSIQVVRMKVQDKEGVPPDSYRLVFHMFQLQDDRSLSSYNIKDSSTLYLRATTSTFTPPDGSDPLVQF